MACAESLGFSIAWVSLSGGHTEKLYPSGSEKCFLFGYPKESKKKTLLFFFGNCMDMVYDNIEKGKGRKSWFEKLFTGIWRLVLMLSRVVNQMTFQRVILRGLGLSVVHFMICRNHEYKSKLICLKDEFWPRTNLITAENHNFSGGNWVFHSGWPSEDLSCRILLVGI